MWLVSWNWFSKSWSLWLYNVALYDNICWLILWSHYSNELYENVIVFISLKERNESAKMDDLENSSPYVGSQAPSLLYEEITDLPSVFKYTQCPVYGMSTTSSTTVQVESHHEYEDVKLNNSDEQIQMTECPAYS